MQDPDTADSGTQTIATYPLVESLLEDKDADKIKEWDEPKEDEDFMDRLVREKLENFCKYRTFS